MGATFSTSRDKWKRKWIRNWSRLPRAACPPRSMVRGTSHHRADIARGWVQRVRRRLSTRHVYLFSVERRQCAVGHAPDGGRGGGGVQDGRRRTGGARSAA